MSRILLAVTACAFVSAPTIARDDKDSGFVKLVHVGSGKVLAVAENSEEAGARAVLAKDDDKEPAQQWQLVKDGTQVKVVNRKTGKVLDVNEASTDEGAAIIQWDAKDDDNDNQRWSWVGEGTDRRLKSKSSSLVVDVDDEGRLIQKKADDKAKGQLWKVVEVKK
jgi:hypothetical protein